MRKIIFITLTLIPFFVAGQKRGSVWCFGDSSLVDFSDTANIITGMSSAKVRGSCVSMSDICSTEPDFRGFAQLFLLDENPLFADVNFFV